MAETSGADRELMTSSERVGNVSVRIREFDFAHGTRISAVAVLSCQITHRQASLETVLYHARNSPLSQDKILKKVRRAVGDYVRYAEQGEKERRTSRAMNSSYFRDEYRLGRRK